MELLETLRIAVRGVRLNKFIVAGSARFLFGVQVMFPPGELLQGLSQF